MPHIHTLKHTREKCKWQHAYKCVLTEDPFFGLFRLIFASCFQIEVSAVKSSADDFVHFVLRFKQQHTLKDRVPTNFKQCCQYWSFCRNRKTNLSEICDARKTCLLTQESNINF